MFSSAGQSDSEKVYLPDSSFLLGCVVGSVFTHRICISIPQKALVISLGTNWSTVVERDAYWEQKQWNLVVRKIVFSSLLSDII